MISRYDAADIGKFVAACEYGYAFDPQGDIQYAVTIRIDNQLHGGAFVVPGEKTYSQDRIAEGISRLYQELVADGLIGHNPLTERAAVTLTGNPLGDLIQVGAALNGIPSTH